jgi:proliferating cell nuclear antigen
MDIDTDTLGIPDTEYDCCVTMESAEFARIVRDLSVLGESVKVDVSKDGVRFTTEGESANGNVLLKQAEGARSKFKRAGKEKGKKSKVKKEDDGEDEEDAEPESEEEGESSKKKKKTKVKKEEGASDGDVEMVEDDDDEEAKPDDDEDDDEDEDTTSKKRKKGSSKVCRRLG